MDWWLEVMGEEYLCIHVFFWIFVKKAMYSVRVESRESITIHNITK